MAVKSINNQVGGTASMDWNHLMQFLHHARSSAIGDMRKILLKVDCFCSHHRITNGLIRIQFICPILWRSNIDCQYGDDYLHHDKLNMLQFHVAERSRAKTESFSWKRTHCTPVPACPYSKNMRSRPFSNAVFSNLLFRLYHCCSNAFEKIIETRGIHSVHISTYF